MTLTKALPVYYHTECPYIHVVIYSTYEPVQWQVWGGGPIVLEHGTAPTVDEALEIVDEWITHRVHELNEHGAAAHSGSKAGWVGLKAAVDLKHAQQRLDDLEAEVEAFVADEVQP